MRETIFAKGVNGQVSIDGDWLTISRKGAMAKMTAGFTKGEKRIPIDNIQAVQIKKPGMTRGYIQFTLSGGKESKKGVFDATSDENSVLFKGSQQTEFERVRDYIERYISRRATPATGAQVPDPLDQLKKLGELRDSGVISNEEFEAKKQQLLGL